MHTDCAHNPILVNKKIKVDLNLLELNKLTRAQIRIIHCKKSNNNIVTKKSCKHFEQQIKRIQISNFNAISTNLKSYDQCFPMPFHKMIKLFSNSQMSNGMMSKITNPIRTLTTLELLHSLIHS